MKLVIEVPDSISTKLSDEDKAKIYLKAILDGALLEEVLEDIKTEIKDIELLASYTRGDILNMCLSIIDKYIDVKELNNEVND